MRRAFGFLLLGVAACAPRQTVQDESAVAPVETLTVLDTIQVETVTVQEEPVITFDEPPAQPSPETTATPLPPAEPAPPPEPRVMKVPGYRVQVFASMYRDKAEAFRDGIVAQWGVKAYVVEEYDPARGLTLFKVRVGNFRDRAAAEAMRDRIRTVWGYTDAFVVEDQVEVER